MQVRILVSLLLGFGSATGVSTAQQPTPIAAIESPAPNATVETKDLVVIRMLQSGQPVVAIRSLEKNSKWWIQESAKSRGSRTFDVPVRFGNDQTPPGTRFQVVALIAVDSETVP